MWEKHSSMIRFISLPLRRIPCCFISICRPTKGNPMSDHLKELLEAASKAPMSDADKEAQRRSFAYGNAHIENERVTREMVDEAADKIKA